MKHDELLLPWHVVRGINGKGVEMLNARGELVAVFEEIREAEHVAEAVNREWMSEQNWLRTAVRNVIREELVTASQQ